LLLIKLIIDQIGFSVERKGIVFLQPTYSLRILSVGEFSSSKLIFAQI